ncbi:MAG: 4-hydroxybutyrate CoA-transferase, partial [Mobilicoccus sp.]|nr:4-hydroxybutyrate CoA-transferase [Mobilicoccus sp.]
MTAQQQYSSKVRDAREAIRLIEDSSTIVVPTGVGEPPTILEALSEARTDFRGVTVSQILPLRAYGYFDPDTAEHVRHKAYFFGGPSRAGGQAGWIDYHPSYFSEMPALIREGLLPVDVVVAMASPMNQHGYFSLGLGADYTMAAVAKAKVVLLEVNPSVPFAYGDCHIHIDQVSAIVEDDRPLLEVGLPTIGPVQEAIAGHVAELIPNGSTLQIGYGAIPDAVVMQLLEKRDLGI